MEEKMQLENQPEKRDRNYKKKRVEEIGSTLAQIRARHKASRSSCSRKDDKPSSHVSKVIPEKLDEKRELYLLSEEDRAKAERLVKERPKIKEALENLILDREQQKLVEKQIEETRAKQAAPLPEISPEIQKRIYEMEMTIHNLRENLGEKDKVLSSKTESLKMLNDQLSERSSEYLKRTEIMKQEINSLKEEYSVQEGLLKNELGRMKNILQQTQLKLQEKEDELSKVAIRDEEFVKLKESHSLCEKELHQVKKNLETVNKTSVKLKAQLKAALIERDNLKKECNPEVVESLQNKIALLEDEKELFNSSQQKIDDIEMKLQEKSDVITILEEQNSLFVHKLENAISTISELENAKKELEESLQEVQQNKVAAEMKLVELEEKYESDDWEEKKQKYEKETYNVKEYIHQLENTIASLTEQKTLKDTDLKGEKDEQIDGTYDGNEWKLKFSEAENKLKSIGDYNETLLLQIKDLEDKNNNLVVNSAQLQNELEHKENSLEIYKTKNEEIMSSLSLNQQIVGTLEQEIINLRSKVEKTQNVNVNVTESDMGAHVQKLKKIASGLKKKKLDLEKQIAELDKKLLEKDELISRINEGKADLEKKLEESKQNISSLEENFVKKEEEIRELESFNKEMKNTYNNLQQKYSEICEKQQMNELELNEMKSQLFNLNNREQEVYQERIEIENLKLQVAQLYSELEKSSDEIIERDKLINEKDTEIDQLIAENRLYQSDLEKMQSELTRRFEGEMLKKEEELNYIKRLESTCSNQKLEIENLIEQVTEMSSKLEQSLEMLEDRTNIIKNLEDEIKGMQSTNETFEESRRIMEEKLNELGLRLQEAEDSNARLETYQHTINIEFKEVFENMTLLEGEKKNLTNEIKTLQQMNKELEAKNEDVAMFKETATSKISEMELELSALKNVRNDYNSTLDQIEILNEDLKQVMAQIEARNQELTHIEEERKILLEKLSVVEDSCTDLLGQLKNSEAFGESLKSELETKEKQLEIAHNEIESMQSQLIAFEKVASENKVKETEMENIIKSYENKLTQAQQEKEEITAALLKSQIANEIDSVMSVAQERAASAMAPQGEEEPCNEEIGLFKWSESTSAKSDLFFKELKDDDDGWGWTPPEMRQEPQPDTSADSSKVQELLQRVQSLEDENSRVSGELRTSQLKCSKLLKKVKEEKAKSEMLLKTQVEKSNSMSGLGDLEFALQKELSGQIDKTEKKNKELSAELNLLKIEKTRMMERIETLVSANERLIEMKERQDIEVQMWQKRSNELKNQVQGLEWTIEELRSIEGKESTDHELEEKLSTLEAENEEFQRIILELKENSKKSDEFGQLKNSSNELPSKDVQERKTDSDKGELEFFKHQCSIISKNNEVLNSQISEISAQCDYLQKSLEEAVSKANTLKAESSKQSEELFQIGILIGSENENPREKLKNLIEENQTLIKDINDLQVEKNKFSEILNILEKDNKELKISLENLKGIGNYGENESILEKLKEENEKLKQELNLLKSNNPPPVFRGFSSVDNEPFSNVPLDQDFTNSELFRHSKEEKQQLEMEVEVFKTEISKVNSEKVKLEKLVLSLESEKNAYTVQKDDIVAYKEEILKANSEKLKLEELVLSLEAERNAFAVQKNDILQQLTGKEEEVQALQKQIFILNGELSAVEEKLSDLEIQLQLKEEYKQLFVGRMKKFKQEIRNMSENTEEVKEALNNLKIFFLSSIREILSIETQVRNNVTENLNRRGCDYEQVLPNKVEDITHVMIKLSSTEEERQALYNENGLLKEENICLKNDLKDAKSKVIELEGRASSFESFIDSLKKENNILKSGQNSESSNLLAQLDYLNQSNSQKDFLIENLSQNVEQQTLQITDLQEHLSIVTNNFKDLENSCYVLETTLQERSNEFHEMGMKLQNLEEENARLKLDNTNSKRIIEENEVNIRILQNLETPQNSSSFNAVANAKKEADLLITMLTEKDVEIDRLSKILSEAQEKLIQAEEEKHSKELLNLQGRLDEALYTLHLRDVRCEELTLEIMQLLEERDTLQLRLSETLRLNERLRKLEVGMNKEQDVPGSSIPEEVTIEKESSPVELELKINPVQTPPTIHEKIGELHSAYRKDPALLQERESRHSQQMQLYTQKAPKEEEDPNISADYGLFNWFFGSSSPTPPAPSPKPSKTT